MSPTSVTKSGSGPAFAFIAPVVLALGFSVTGALGDGLLVLPVAAAIAGVASGTLVRMPTAGLLGLLAGLSLASAVWGILTIVEKVQACGSECDGFSGPIVTVWIVVGAVALAVVTGCVGFLLGRLVRRASSGAPSR